MVAAANYLVAVLSTSNGYVPAPFWSAFFCCLLAPFVLFGKRDYLAGFLSLASAAGILYWITVFSPDSVILWPFSTFGTQLGVQPYVLIWFAIGILSIESVMGGWLFIARWRWPELDPS